MGPTEFLREGFTALASAGMLFLFCVPASGAAQDEFHTLFVMEMADEPSTIDQHKIQISLQQLAAELKVDERELPCILVFHISKATAKKLKIAGSSSWHTSGGPSPRYEMWIVGEPSDYIYVGLALRILEHQFGLEIEDSERARVVETVRTRLAATTNVQVSTREGSRRKHLSRPN